MTPLPHNELSFVISIPLIGDPRLNMKLYEIISIPTPIKKGFTINYSNLPAYIGVTDDRTLYAELELADLELCRKFDTNYLCPVAFPIFRNNAPSCSLDLFNNLSGEKTCNKKFSPRLSRP